MMPTSRSATVASLHDPVERFRGSHAAIVDGLAELRRLPMLFEALKQAELTAEATLALFQRQILPHHLEEEQELFAAVCSAAKGPEKEIVEGLVTRLVAQHRRIEQLWMQLRPSVVAIAAGKAQTSPAFRDEVLTLVDTYLDHTRLEERMFLPLADDILSRHQDHTPVLVPSEHLRHAMTTARRG
jgi:hypothetical protein